MGGDLNAEVQIIISSEDSVTHHHLKHIMIVVVAGSVNEQETVSLPADVLCHDPLMCCVIAIRPT